MDSGQPLRGFRNDDGEFFSSLLDRGARIMRRELMDHESRRIFSSMSGREAAIPHLASLLQQRVDRKLDTSEGILSLIGTALGRARLRFGGR